MAKKMIESIALNEVNSIEMPDKSPLVHRDISVVGHVMVQLSAEIGHVEVSLDQLFKTKSGDVLTMREALDTPLTLNLNGKAIARGILVAVDDYFGVRITELA